MDDPLALAILASACATAEGALPEREPHPAVFQGLVQLIARLPQGADALTDYVRWEATLLTELGYGLDLARCAVTGAESGLAWVSPRTGRAVAEEAAGEWRSRLLRLPGFFAGANSAEPGGLARRAAVDGALPGTRRLRPPAQAVAGRPAAARGSRRGLGRGGVVRYMFSHA